ncbi:Tumor necrosis factor receptor superfamily member 6 [Paramuricea clavata]|uniref:Tumor necrosis factor receptor superfamily member 6 n=1 Tax=Paramuricea clavata TaxID=317549 RepID=A0A6S7KEE4_PARCT|nr:Tumor necrosis factor receptor superfamily member 6 [Paramuricea clavata]
MTTALECDDTTHYTVESNGKVMKCTACRVCYPGYEPRVPCGKIIGASVSVGDCDPCKNGTYSPKKDVKACQDCHHKKCFDHQVVEGTCTDKNDKSRCTDKCEEGYSMNNEGTVCEDNLARQNETKTLATKTTSNNSPTSRTTTRNTTNLVILENQTYIKESKLAPGAIAGIVCAVIFVLVIVIVILSVRWYKSRNTEQGDKNDEESPGSSTEMLDKPDAEVEKREAVNFSKMQGNVFSDTEKNDSANTSSTSLDEIKDDVTEPLSQQEECQHNDLLTSDGPHQETTGGFVDPSQSNNVGNDVSGTVMGYTPTNNVLAMPSGPGMQDKPPETVLQDGLPETLIPQRAPAAVTPNYLQVNDPHLTRFDDLSSQIYNEICGTFDAGTAGIGWTDLAGWLDLTVKDVKTIRIVEDKTNQLIQRWAVETENTVARFVAILEKHKMTCLVDKINTELNYN